MEKKENKKNRNHVVKFRVTDDELLQLKHNCTNSTLGRWARDTLLGGKTKEYKPTFQGNQNIHIQLIRIGTNLNQIAKKVNINETNIKNIELLGILEAMQITLNEMKKSCS